MIKKEIPVLLTSSVVAHDSGVALADTDERVRLAIESVAHWLMINPDLPLVLCDGSSFDFTPIVRKKFPLARIECLHFENQQRLVKQYGRGYGEGEIVCYAVRNSTLITDANCFVKCTSKLWVENFEKCLLQWNGELLCKGVFLDVFSPFKKTHFAYIDTRFYIASNTCYHQYFEDAHLRINKELGYGLEQCFYDVFIKHRIQHCLFSIPPIICGVGGGTGVYYKNSLMRRLKERLRLTMVRFTLNFRNMFSQQ